MKLDLECRRIFAFCLAAVAGICTLAHDVPVRADSEAASESNMAGVGRRTLRRQRFREMEHQRAHERKVHQFQVREDEHTRKLNPAKNIQTYQRGHTKQRAARIVPDNIQPQAKPQVQQPGQQPR